jgi:hypothetical protein
LAWTWTSARNALLAGSRAIAGSLTTGSLGAPDQVVVVTKLDEQHPAALSDVPNDALGELPVDVVSPGCRLGLLPRGWPCADGRTGGKGRHRHEEPRPRPPGPRAARSRGASLMRARGPRLRRRPGGREIQDIELAAAGLEQSILALRGRDAAQQIEYEQRVARLAAEVVDVRAEAFLRAPTSGRIVTVQRAAGRSMMFALAPAGSRAR